MPRLDGWRPGYGASTFAGGTGVAYTYHGPSRTPPCIALPGHTFERPSAHAWATRRTSVRATLTRTLRTRTDGAGAIREPPGMRLWRTVRVRVTRTRTVRIFVASTRKIRTPTNGVGRVGNPPDHIRVARKRTVRSYTDASNANKRCRGGSRTAQRCTAPIPGRVGPPRAAFTLWGGRSPCRRRVRSSRSGCLSLRACVGSTCPVLSPWRRGDSRS